MPSGAPPRWCRHTTMNAASDGDEQRQPAAVSDLAEVRRDEREFEAADERSGHRDLPHRPVPGEPGQREQQTGGDDQCAGHRHPVGRGQSRGRSEGDGHHQHGDEQERVYGRDIDLTGVAVRGLADGESRQQTESDRLPDTENAPEITAWDAMTVAAVASSTAADR
jgi:hypothetical protein